MGPGSRRRLPGPATRPGTRRLAAPAISEWIRRPPSVRRSDRPAGTAKGWGAARGRAVRHAQCLHDRYLRPVRPPSGAREQPAHRRRGDQRRGRGDVTGRGRSVREHAARVRLRARRRLGHRARGRSRELLRRDDTFLLDGGDPGGRSPVGDHPVRLRSDRRAGRLAVRAARSGDRRGRARPHHRRRWRRPSRSSGTDLGRDLGARLRHGLRRRDRGLRWCRRSAGSRPAHRRDRGDRRAGAAAGRPPRRSAPRSPLRADRRHARRVVDRALPSPACAPMPPLR
jgi:hypothetical protein